MDIVSFIITIICGAIAGWAAAKIMNSKNSLIVNIILGIVGGVVGGFILNLIGIGATGYIGGILVAIFGACVLIWASRFIAK